MKRITAIGDSITRGIDSESWAYRLIMRLNPSVAPTASAFAPWSGLSENQKLSSTGFEFYNAGIQGDTTTQELARFSNDVLGHATDYCIIAGGVNDLNAGTAVGTIEANLAAMADLCVAAGVIPIMATLTPYNAGTGTQRANLRTVNAWIRGYAAAMGYGLIDWFEALEYPVGSGNSPWLGDGVHPTVFGDLKIADCIDLALFWEQPSAPIAHWIVRADGKVQDLVSGAFATVNGVEGAALPSFRKRPDGRGYEGFFATGTTCDIPTTGWNRLSSTVLFVGQTDWETTTIRRFFRLDPTSGLANYVQCLKGNGVLQVAGSFYGADGTVVSPTIQYPQEVASPAGAQQCVFGIMWNAGTVYMHLNGTRVLGVGTATDAMGGIAATAQIGRSSTSYFDGGSTIGQVVVYDRMLSHPEIAREYLRLVGGMPVAPESEPLTIDSIKRLVDAVTAKTDNLPTSPAAVGSAMTLTSAYDAAKTAAQAAVCTEARLAELDAANLPADVDTLKGRVVGTIAAGTHNPQSGDAYAVVNHTTHGNSAINTALGSPLQAADYPVPQSWVTITHATLADDNSGALGPVRVGGVLRAGVTVEALLADGTVKNSTVTDGDGEFSLAVPPGATYSVRFSYDGHTSAAKGVTV